MLLIAAVPQGPWATGSIATSKAFKTVTSAIYSAANSSPRAGFIFGGSLYGTKGAVCIDADAIEDIVVIRYFDRGNIPTVRNEIHRQSNVGIRKCLWQANWDYCANIVTICQQERFHSLVRKDFKAG